MEPRIQYAKTSDGVSIAFWAIGEGKPMIRAPSGPWGLTVESKDPGATAWYERLAQRYTAVVYDSRGIGLSGGAVDWSFAAQMRDLDAVADHLNAGTFVLVGPMFGGPTAIAYAAAHPERVSHLLLWCSWARTADVLRTPQAQAFLALMDEDWEVLTETLTRIILGWSTDASSSVAVAFRESLTPELMRSYIDAVRRVDATDLLPRLGTPSLVVHNKQALFPGREVAKDLTSRIPNARLVLLEGTAAPWAGDMEANARAIEEFLGDTDEAQAEPAPSGLVTILFTDLVGSTSLTQSLGDSRAQELLRAHNTIVRKALKAQGGSEIKHTGDGIMAWFALASSAVECAVAIQRAFDSRAGEHGESPLRVRIGLNAGEPVIEDEDLFGTAVQLAARICTHAEAGQILVSNVVRELAVGKGLPFSARRDVALKGFEGLVRLCEVRWRQGEADGPPLPIHEPPAALTVRETQVLSLLASGQSGKEIAAELSVSLSTVQRHIANVYAKIGARGRVEAAAYAVGRGLVQPPSD